MNYLTDLIIPIILIGFPIEATCGLIMYERWHSKQLSKGVKQDV